ncbi:MAG: hypothetical protein A2W25_10705 [candidate division Zixibacteria bacterium RBG_16_53_22]|nr:MAG: hypothetical protein A2W25_10705 [candidate division Zixibacteria bacterium RBG_16_53_22]
MTGYSAHEENRSEFTICAGSTPLYRIVRTKDYITISSAEDDTKQFKMLAGVEAILSIAFDKLANN